MTAHPSYAQQDLDQSYYQNVGPNGQPQQQLQQHMPLRYHQQQQRYGSQTSLQQRGNESNQRPPSLSNYSVYPPVQSSGSGIEQRFPPLDEIHHASPRIIGTPMSSNSVPSRYSNPNKLVKPSEVTPTGPEKPQRQYSYQDEQPQIGDRSAKSSTASRVRFQDVDGNKGDDQTDKIELQLEQLRLSSVEREFRKRIAEYNGGKSINGAGDSGSDSEDRRRMPPTTYHGQTYSGSGINANVGAANNQSRIKQERIRKMETVERKQKELDDTYFEEERILSNARPKAQSNITSSQTPTPPPLPESLPPENIVNNPSVSPSQLQSGAARLDLLVGGVTSNSNHQRSDTNYKSESKDATTTKRVSFVTSPKHAEDERKISSASNVSNHTDSNANVSDDKYYRLERAEEKGPNVSNILFYNTA